MDPSDGKEANSAPTQLCDCSLLRHDATHSILITNISQYLFARLFLSLLLLNLVDGYFPFTVGRAPTAFKGLLRQVLPGQMVYVLSATQGVGPHYKRKLTGGVKTFCPGRISPAKYC